MCAPGPIGWQRGSRRTDRRGSTARQRGACLDRCRTRALGHPLPTHLTNAPPRLPLLPPLISAKAVRRRCAVREVRLSAPLAGKVATHAAAHSALRHIRSGRSRELSTNARVAGIDFSLALQESGSRQSAGHGALCLAGGDRACVLSSPFCCSLLSFQLTHRHRRGTSAPATTSGIKAFTTPCSGPTAKARAATSPTVVRPPAARSTITMR